MLRRILFRLFWNTYDNLGGWLLVSAAAFALSLPLVTAPAAWGSLLGCAARAERECEFSLRTFWEDFRRFGSRSTLLGALLALGLLLCLVNIYFYAVSPVTHGWPTPLRLGLAGFFFWLALFGTLGVQIAWAFLVMQDLGVKKAFARGFLVLGGHPFTALGVAAVGMGLTLLMALSAVGLVVLQGALMANLMLGLAAGAVEHYDELEDRRERARLEREGARTWGELRALDEREAARRRRYQRGWRELLRPWEMR